MSASGGPAFDKVVEIGAGGDSEPEFSLLEVLDHVLNSGVVIQGSIVISLAGVDLVYVGLSAVISSIETALQHVEHRGKMPLPAARPRR